MNEDIENDDVSSGYGFMNIGTGLQHNGLISLIKYNGSNDTDMNANLQNGDVSSAIGLLNIHILLQDNDPSNLNDMNISVENGDINGDYCCMISFTGSESKNQNSIDFIQRKYIKVLPTYI